MRAAKQTYQRLALMGLAVWTFGTAVFAQNELPKEFEQIVPRGQIAAIYQPAFVPASEANITGNAMVLGVVLDGEARAFSLNLLNFHEVVNDSIGETDYAAVW